MHKQGLYCVTTVERRLAGRCLSGLNGANDRSYWPGQYGHSSDIACVTYGRVRRRCRMFIQSASSNAIKRRRRFSPLVAGSGKRAARRREIRLAPAVQCMQPFIYSRAVRFR